MYFGLLILAILGYAYYIDFNSIDESKFYKKYMPIFLLFFITFAFQYNVGTDYQSYIACGVRNELGVFKLGQFIEDREFLFALIVYVAQVIKFPQFIFIASSFIQNVLFAITLKEIKKKDLSIFYFLVLYFGLSLCFFNQFNGIRQFISIQFIVLATIKILNNDKSVSIILYIVSVFFHKSSVIFILFIILYFIMEKYNIFEFLDNKKIFFIICLLLLSVYLVDFNSLILFVAKKLNFFAEYGLYEKTNLYVSKMGIADLLTKFLKLAVVYYSLYRLNLEKVNSFEKKLLHLSYFSVFVMILSFSSTLIWRVYLFYDLFLIIPTLLFFKYDARMTEKQLIISYLYIILFVKIILIPKGEYAYHSYFFNK